MLPMLPAVVLLLEDENDRVFMTRLYMEYRGLMFALAYAMLGSAEEAQDAVNDAVVCLIEKVSVLRGKPRCILRSYIVSTIRHTAIDALRKRARKSEPLLILDAEDAAPLEDEAASIDAEVAARADHEDFLRALTAMPERDRHLLQWKYYDEWSDEEIAKLLGIGRNSVRAALWKARKRLREELERQGFRHEE